MPKKFPGTESQAAFAARRRARLAPTRPRPAKPSAIIAQVEGSGTDAATKSISAKPFPVRAAELKTSVNDAA